ncbi:hypothetical protein E6C27_scaffold465G00230 [Cucumis melo var. makuwa]|uniref:Uncharacterized protein n=1 Tax=Cucumis melo var. makuwa TaxID=1194695 RepID=A0A5A7STH3_CUCMM|nr:hypothetical protein E6C27_scaffold465G00230 [Cucumis melo var. makuwa]
MSSISKRVANRASHVMVPCIMWWNCTYSPELKVIESQVFESQMVRYKDSLATPLRVDDALLAYAHAQYQLPIPVHPREDNLAASVCDTSGSSTYTELELEASTNHMDSRLDNIEFELNRMKSSFTAE